MTARPAVPKGAHSAGEAEGTPVGRARPAEEARHRGAQHEGSSASYTFNGVQYIVLNGRHWEVACHLALQFGPEKQAPRFLELLQDHCLWPAAAHADLPQPTSQVSLGLTRRGLAAAQVPAHVLACFALKAPAFHAGAALRAGRQLGAFGADGPEGWNKAFGFTELDAVLSLHAMDQSALAHKIRTVRRLARLCGIRVRCMGAARRLLPPSGSPSGDRQQWIHFDYRDGLSRVPIKGWQHHAAGASTAKARAPGEFILGLPQDSGANPWIAGAGKQVWPAPLRDFFRHGSFGVLHKIEQHVTAFEQFLDTQVEQLLSDRAVLSAAEVKAMGEPEARRQIRNYLKAKLCGRTPEGEPVHLPGTAPQSDFDYRGDDKGYGCPLGAHARRMNPRGDGLAQDARTRFLLRRGMPYGRKDNQERGLMGQFFCASIEDQYEHLLGQWADRVPMGSADGGGARDPLIGAHAPGDGYFEIPRDGAPALRIEGLQPFTRTRGVAYLFYPSLGTLQGIADNKPWREPDEEDDA